MKLRTPASTSTSPQPSAPCRIELGWPALTTSATPSSATPSRTNVARAGRTFVRCQSTSAVSKGPSATISDAVSGRACASPVYANRLNPANPSEPTPEEPPAPPVDPERSTPFEDDEEEQPQHGGQR